MHPATDDYAPAFAGYVGLVPEDEILHAMAEQTSATQTLLAKIDESRSEYRYAEGKWSIKEMIGHLGDAERVFGYRAMCIARGEQQSLPGYDENEYMAKSGYASWKYKDTVEQWAILRAANSVLFRNLSTEAWDRRGEANGAPVTVHALARIIVGHERHHMKVLTERYGV
jgi:uncharacterized damage-inducible protein DinB